MEQQRNLLGSYRRAGRLLAVCGVALATNAMAADITGNAYSVTASGAPAAASTIRITGPQGFAANADSLSYSSDERLPDGSYRYEIFGELADSYKDSPLNSKNQLDNGRDEEAISRRSSRRIGVIDSGNFQLLGGQVQDANSSTEEE